jgi:taurine dioxygenase
MANGTCASDGGEMIAGSATRLLAPAIGTVICGLDLGCVMYDAEAMRSLVALLHERGVLVVKDQRLSDADYVRFGHYWGRPLEFFIPGHRDYAFPAIIRIDNDPATPPSMRDGAVHWHSDSSYEEEPAAVTMLYGKEAPEEGGVTLFASTRAAYEALPPLVRADLDGLVAVHELGQAPWIAGETQPDPARPKSNLPRQHHPLIMRHPVTGRRAIFTSATACAIEGMGASEGRALIRALREHVVQPQFRADYKLVPGDIVLWDNFSTVHSASPIEYSGAPGKRRRLCRISTKGMTGVSLKIDESRKAH